MNRSILIALSLGLIATPALAQQPLQPAYPPNGEQAYDPNAAQPQAQQQVPQQPMDPYAQYGDTSDDEDEGLDVSYDISTSQDDQQYDDGYDPNAYQQFESTLSPYGSWQDVPDYGHVWVPSVATVGYDFTPYASGGHWVMSDYGWTWVSDWDWGWAPFHYGRWMVVGGHGWCWLPGTHWGPAWVHWRWGGGYVGWAPMGPRGVVIGAPRGVRSPWRFTVAGQLGAPRPHFLPSRAVASVWHTTTPIHNVSTVNLHGTNVRFNAGPSSHLFTATTGRAIAPTPLRSVAPRALPNQAITPRASTPIQSRPWMQNRAIGGQTIARAPQPLYSRQPVTIQHPGGVQPYRAPQSFSRAPQPLYRAPQPVYRAPVQQPYRAYGYGAQQPYRAPTQMQQPQYHYPAAVQQYHPAPQYHYSAPMQSYHPAPQYHYSAPAQSFHSAPSYSAPAQSFHSSPAPSYHSSGGFSGGGGFHGGGGAFHGGGGRR